MAMKMRIETPIAFGLTLTVCLVLFFYCWRIRKIRHRLTGSVQVSALPIADSTVPAEEQTGIKKEVIATFPTVKVHELKDDIKEGCPICLVEYAATDLLRKLPRCGHVFHMRCVDSWLEHQVTCPVCRIVLTDPPNSSKETRYRRSALRAPSVTTVEVPAWVLVNRPMPLPPAIAADSSPPLESSCEPHMDIDVDVGVAPLLEHQNSAAGWGAVYLENQPHGLSFTTRGSSNHPATQTGHPTGEQTGIHQIGIQTKECVHHASISERWMTESFVFGISGSDVDTGSPKASHSDEFSYKRHASWSSRSVNSTSCDSNQISQLLTHWLPAWELEDDVVLESTRVTPFRPLTMSPERCSFEFLPIVTADGVASRSPAAPWVGPNRLTFYSQL